MLESGVAPAEDHRPRLKGRFSDQLRKSVAINTPRPQSLTLDSIELVRDSKLYSKIMEALASILMVDAMKNTTEIFRLSSIGRKLT